MDPMFETTTISLSALAKHGFIAVLGGIAHAINKHRMGQTKGILDIVALAFMSAFFGVLFGFIALATLQNEHLTLSVAGVGGWLGIESTGILIEFVRKMLSLPPTQEK